MDKYGWVLLLCVVILAVAVITLSILRFGKKKTSIVYLAPPFSKLFTEMRNTDNITLVNDKAFRITSAATVAPTRDAFVVNENTTQTQIADNSNLIGFVFSSSIPITLTSFQILASTVVANRSIPRMMAIYEVDSKNQLALSVVDPNRDHIDASGFYTAELSATLDLQANKQYVLVAQSVPFDVLPLRVAETGVSFTSPILFISGARTNNTSNMDYPAIVPSDAPVFASFQFRDTTAGVATTVFGVDPANGGFPSGPPHYLNGCVASVPESGKFVLVQPGIAVADQDDVSSIVLQQPTKIFPNKTGLNGLDVGSFTSETWYYIFVVSADVASLPTGCVVSLDRVTPRRMPDGYTHSRRIGTVRTSSTSTFYAMQQENLGRRRTTFFTGDAELRNFVSDGVASDHFVSAPLTFVPPTATIVSVGVRGREFSSLSPPTLTPINAILEFRPALDIDQVVTLGISDAVVTYGQIDVPLDNAILPQTIAYKLFPKPGTGGSIPDQQSPFEQFRINCAVIKYVEIL